MKTDDVMVMVVEMVMVVDCGADCGGDGGDSDEQVDEEGMKLMAQDNIFAVLLPTTAYVLRIPPPPARALIDAGRASILS